MEDKAKDERSEPDDKPRDQDSSGGSLGVLAIIFFLMSLPIGSLALLGWFQSRLTEGQLVLTRTGCQALEYHGARVRYLEDATACAIDTRFRIGLHARSGQVLIQTDHGPLEVELSGREVISLAYR